MITIHPIKLTGNWYEGYSLDIHTISSQLIGYDQYGHEYFDTQRSELGELVYKLKYGLNKAALKEIVITSTNFLLKDWTLVVDAIVAVPPSKSRDFQPVAEIAKGISSNVKIPYVDLLKKVKDTPELKNVSDYQRRHQILNGAFGVKSLALKGKRVLLVDDLYRSGATLNAITDTLYSSGKLKRVYVMTMTKTRSRL